MDTGSRIFILTACLAVFACEQVSAHTRWKPGGVLSPRADAQGVHPTDLKFGPCGNLPRSPNPARLTSGATIDVEFESNIFHQGYFRIAFSLADDTGFDRHVLIDDIPDYATQVDRSLSLTLPDVECDTCTLQLIQVMMDRTPPTNYYSCADIQLVSSNGDGDDLNAPGAVESVLALPGDSEVQLGWVNPSAPDLAGVLVLESMTAVASQPQPGQSYSLRERIGEAVVVYNGPVPTVRLNERVNGQDYHYQLFAFDNAFNYSPVVTTGARPLATEENIMPHVSIAVEQDQRTGMDISSDGGLVVAQANISDLNRGDRHSVDWSLSDPRLLNVSDQVNQFIFDPSRPGPDDYVLTVVVTDDGLPPLSATASVTLKLKGERQTDASGGSTGVGMIGLLLALMLGLRRRQQI